MLPQFVKDADLGRLSNAKLQQLKETTEAGWFTVHASLALMPDTEESMMMLLVMLKHELENGKRPHIADRIRARYSAIRAKLEKKAVYDCLKNSGRAR
jgi:hypothetical protein